MKVGIYPAADAAIREVADEVVVVTAMTRGGAMRRDNDEGGTASAHAHAQCRHTAEAHTYRAHACNHTHAYTLKRTHAHAGESTY